MSAETKLYWVAKTALDKLGRRIITIWNKRHDTRSAVQAAPYGVDSNPIKDMRAVYGRTEGDGPTFVQGYFNKKLLAEPGDIRLYCTDENGEIKGYVWLKNAGTGTLELLGDEDFAVLFSKLKQEFNKLKQDYNDLVTKFNTLNGLMSTHTHPYVNVVTPAVTSPFGGQAPAATPNISNIDLAKNSRIKTNGS